MPRNPFVRRSWTRQQRTPGLDTGTSIKITSVLCMSAALSINEESEINPSENSPQQGGFVLEVEDSDDDGVFTGDVIGRPES